ncbi:MAG: LysM peptidoglycan-binding domain-containing protein [Cyclobacteriaceae bacterium]|nr:LysM peptidoglycan-binding domain-containing protein [Cyclobacteriaceae bacterium]
MRFFSVVLFLAEAAVSLAQSPEVPHKMNVAGIMLTLRDDARREIQKDVDALTQSPRYFNVKAERARTYFPIIERIFKEERVPDDLKYLVLQESALIADAVSSSNAVGFWQFKDMTAREMGLRVDEQIDERMNIVSASRGAAKYFRQSNNYFNNWIHVVQSYQMGIGGARNVIPEDDIGSRHLTITSDTYWYVKKYLAHVVAFQLIQTQPASTEAVLVPVQEPGSASDLAKEFSLPEEDLLAFNKWIRKGQIPGDRVYTLVIPKGKAVADFDKLYLATGKTERTPNVKSAAPGSVLVDIEFNQLRATRIKAGESLIAVSSQFGISADRLASFNDVSKDYIPAGETVIYLERKLRRGPAGEYVARSNETLWSISQQFGIRLRSLEKLNAVASHQPLKAGTRILLGKQGHASDAGIDPVELDKQEFDWTLGWEHDEKVNEIPRYHVVRKTETLFGIAQYYGIEVDVLMAWNGKKDTSIVPGERLRLSMDDGR